MGDDSEPSGAGPPAGGWDRTRVRRLRDHLGETQAELAERLGTRQQTVSEWETGVSRPRRMSGRLLQLVAEEAGFYDAASSDAASSDAASEEASDAARRGTGGHDLDDRHDG